MRKKLYLLLALMVLFGCRSKKSSRTELKEEQKSERKEVKDSSTRVEKSQKVATFNLQHSQSYELTIESDRDSVGNAKEVVYHRIRDGDGEIIRVRNGKVILKTIDNLSKSLHKADTTLVINNQISQKTEAKNQYIEQSKQVQKEVKKTSSAFIIGALILGVVAWILWRFKLFR